VRSGSVENVKLMACFINLLDVDNGNARVETCARDRYAACFETSSQPIREWLDMWWGQVSELAPYEAAIQVGDRALEVAALRRDEPLSCFLGWCIAAADEEEAERVCDLMRLLDVPHPDDMNPLFVAKETTFPREYECVCLPQPSHN
jgi:hypothetical protein